ncbi:uncharacterized protein Triagg1_4016 [Trichoderma aggressivum f. europaeum]|uniref:F-box domain-containing protein n=1 Tax=Trichoderma aggressivum f. europaeum TaxID=173218 RepID=A0AAE1IEM8_9HYPO|nr:hypothetical protein Triagg1_4016 [Trichoderma aggressivum f. europaeum]
MDVNQKQSLRQKVRDRLSGSSRSRSTVGPRDKDPVEIALEPISPQRPRDNHGFVHRQTILSCFLQLPPELQFKILGYLDFGEILRLRQSCRLFRDSINHQVMTTLFPQLVETMLSTCYICLRQMRRDEVVLGNGGHVRYPMTSKCFNCMAKRSGFTVGRLYTLANSEQVYACRWCGIPVTAEMGYNRAEYHNACYQKFKVVLWLHYKIGVMQWVVVIALVMAIWASILNFARGLAMRTYHWSVLTELLIIVAWIPPMYELVDKGVVNRSTSDLPVSQSAIYATLAVIALNIYIQLTDLLLQDVAAFELDGTCDIVLRVEDVATIETGNQSIAAHDWKSDDDSGDFCRSPELTARLPGEMVV